MSSLKKGKSLIHTKEIYEKSHSDERKGARARHMNSHIIDFQAIARVKN